MIVDITISTINIHYRSAQAYYTGGIKENTSSYFEYMHRTPVFIVAL